MVKRPRTAVLSTITIFALSAIATAPSFAQSNAGVSTQTTQPHVVAQENAPPPATPDPPPPATPAPAPPPPTPEPTPAGTATVESRSYVQGGAYFPSPPTSGTTFALGYSYTLPVSLGPVSPQASVLVPFANGRYMFSGEVRTTGKWNFGIGAGYGNLARQGAGFIVDLLAGAPLPIRHTSIIAKFFSGTATSAGSGGLIGLQFRLP
jgi:hypothetical protein